MRFLKSEADSVALSLFSVKYFIFKCFLFLCGYCGPPCNFCVLSLFSIFSPHEFLCPLSGAAVWTRLIMLAWTNNDTLMWWLLVQVTKVLLCALQLIIEAWLPLPQLRALGVSCPISPSWYEHCLYTNMSMSMSMSMGTEKWIVMRGACVYFCMSELGSEWQVTPAPTPGSCWHPNIADGDTVIVVSV